MNREYYLDNLKVFLTVVVILIHSGAAYWDEYNWYYTPSNPNEFLPWMWKFLAVAVGFSMGLFFLISGYFVPTSYDRNGGKMFIKKKLMRLGIPLLVMGCLIESITQPYNIGHVWFLESLLLFCLVYALIRKICKPIVAERSIKLTVLFITLLGLFVGIGAHFIRKVSPMNVWIWPFDLIPIPMEPAHYLQYVVLFITGILASRFNWFKTMSKLTGGISLAEGVTLAIGICIIDKGGRAYEVIDSCYAFYESMMGVFLCFGLIWLFRQAFASSSKFMRWCSEQAYGAYIFHLPILLGLQYSTDSIWMGGGLVKWLFVALITIVATFTFTWLVRLIPGVKNVL